MLAHFAVNADNAFCQTYSQPRVAHSGEIVVNTWPANLWNALSSSFNSGVYALTQNIFDGIDVLGATLLRSNYVELGVKTQRQVFDNQDILNTYTVIDRLTISTDSRELRLSTQFFTQNLSLGFVFGVGGNLNFTNIRQINSKRYDSLPSLEEELSQLDDTTFSSSAHSSESSLVTQGLRPQTNQLWGLMTFPFKLPLTLRRLDRLEDGELMSYAVEGYVELGPEFGVAIAPENPVGNIGVRVNYVTFLSGEFRIAVLKENARYVKVKLTKIKNKGTRFSTVGDARGVNYFKGFLLFKGTQRERRILSLEAQVVPFEFSIEKRKIKQLDIGYRYDLNDPKAKAAFKKALYGSFSLSESYQGKSNEHGDKPVEKLFTKNSQGSGGRSAYQFDMSVYRRRNSSDTTSIEATLSLPDGQHKTFKESRTVSTEWKTIWGRFEKVNYNYTISLDKTAFTSGKPNSLQMVIEANINDSHTSGKEVRRYIHDVRAALGKPDLLPDLPLKIPGRNGRFKKARYKRSTFYYGFNLNQNQLIKFIKTKPKKMWGLLEKAFSVKKGQWSSRYARTKYRALRLGARIMNLPLAVISAHSKRGSNLEVAKRIYKVWSKLSRSFDKNLSGKIEKKIGLLSKMFKAKHFGHEALRLVLLSLEHEKLDYFLVAYNDTFGPIARRGETLVDPEYLANLTDDSVGFNRSAGASNIDTNTLIKNLKTQVKSNKVFVNFYLTERAKFFYFRLTPRSRSLVQRGEHSKKSEFIFKNLARFNKGHNQFEIDKASLDIIGLRLADTLSDGKSYSLIISTSVDGKSWTRVAASSFKYHKQVLLPHQ